MTNQHTLGDPATFAKWAASLNGLALKQLPYAISLALNESMFMARKSVIQDYPGRFAGGLGYLRKTMRIQPSNKKQNPINATIGEGTGYMMQQQAGHIKRGQTGPEVAVPTNYALEKYKSKGGRIRKQGWPSKLIRQYKSPQASGKMGGNGHQGAGDGSFFPIVSKGKRMIIQRDRGQNRIAKTGDRKYPAGTFRPFYIYTKSAKVEKRWAFDLLVINAARATFPRNLRTSLAKALASAK